MTASPHPAHRFITLACLFALLPWQGRAASFAWDADPGTANNQNGSGMWTSGQTPANSNWTSGDLGGGPQAAWINGLHIAKLGATSGYSNNNIGGTITLGENITVNRIDKSSLAALYTINGSDGFKLILTRDTSSGFAGLGNNSAGVATALVINADMDAGVNEMTKFNNGVVILAGNNTWSGGTRITAHATSGSNSVLQIGNGGTTGNLGTGNVSFSSGTNTGAQSVLAFNRTDMVSLTQNLVSGGPTDTNKGILRQTGTGTLVVASENTAFVGAVEVVTGILQVGDGATGGSLGTIEKATLSANATLSFNRTDAVIFSAPILGAGRVLKTGSGTLTLAGTASTYSGGTVIEAGVLKIANDNALPTGTNVSFTGLGTLDLDGFNQTVGTMTVANGITGTIIGTGSTLTAGGSSWVIGGTASNTLAVLDMSGLDNFVFNGSGQNLSVGGTFVTNDAAFPGNAFADGTLILAKNNIITAANVNVSNVNAGGANHENRGTLILGQTNLITAGNLNIGAEFKNQGFVRFAEGSTDGSVTLRGTAANQRMNVTIGRHDSNGVVIDESSFDSTLGTLDAMVNILLMGVTNDRARPGEGRFSMGQGLLDATTIVLGRRISSASSTAGQGASSKGTLELDGGTILARTIIFADKLDAGTFGTVTGIFNFKSGTLRAENLQGGAGTTGVSRLLNWTAGNILTYDANTDLLMRDLTIQLQGVGTRNFEVGTGRTITVNSAIINGGTAPTVAFTKLGTGTLLLGGTGSTHTGSINIQAGILRTTANDVLSDGTTLHFPESTTVDLQGFSDTVANLTVTPGKTATVIGAQGSLTLKGGPNWIIGGNIANTTTTLDLSGLGHFNYDSINSDIHLGSLGNQANNIVNVYFAAQSNTIKAKSFGIASQTDGATNGQNVANVYLGKTNTINATSILIGNYKSRVQFQYAAGVTDGSLRIRGTDGTSRATVVVGKGQSGAVNTNVVMDVSAGSLDALIGTLTIGQNDNSGVQKSDTLSSLVMSTGTLDANTIILGLLSNNSTDATYRGSGTLTLNGTGTIIANLINFSHRTNATAAGMSDGILNLRGGGTLQAATIQRGASPSGTATFNWDHGTIKNYNATTDLSITDVNLTLNSSGSRTFEITANRTATVNSSLVNGTTPGTEAFTKTGTGRLILNAASTYTGRTTIQEGALFVANSTGSATGSGSLLINSNGTLTGTGRIAPTGSAGLLNQGTLKAGGINGTAAGTLTLDLSNTTGSLSSTGTLVFDLFTNAGDNSAISTAADRLLLIGVDAAEISLSGTLHLGLGSNSTLETEDFSEGDRWLLVDWTGITGGLPTVNFSQIDSVGFTLPTELKWTYEFNQTGLFAVITVVPEPSRMLLLWMGMSLLFLRRRPRQ